MLTYVTNGTFAIVVIPECKAYSITELGRRNGFEIVRGHYNPDLDYILPYRKPYDRIIRAIAADLHAFTQENIGVTFDIAKWPNVRDVSLTYINNWIETGDLPIVKPQCDCHSGYFSMYLTPAPLQPASYVLIDVENIDAMRGYINEKYNVDIGEIPELPENFYDCTIPYWEIDQLYKENKKLRTLIDKWCAEDLTVSATTVVDNLFINA